jgi:hypothetical protein
METYCSSNLHDLATTYNDREEENKMPGKAKVHHLFSNKCITILFEGLQPEYQDFPVSCKDQFLTYKLTHWETIFDISVP